jgi:hypothetical protein
LPTWQHGLAPGRSGLVADSKPWHQSGGSLVAVWSSSWEAAPDCFPDCLPDPFPDPSLEQLLGSCSRPLQTPIPGTCSWRVSGAHFYDFSGNHALGRSRARNCSKSEGSERGRKMWPKTGRNWPFCVPFSRPPSRKPI